jgi:hypothetical protein
VGGSRRICSLRPSAQSSRCICTRGKLVASPAQFRETRKSARSTLASVFSCSRCSERSFEKSGDSAHQKDPISTAYEFRTKSAQSGGLEKWPERRNCGSLPVRCSVQVCARGPVFTRDCFGLASERRMLDADSLAEGEELGSNILRPEWSGNHRLMSALAPKADK